jgi:hypothetical protein
MAMLKSVDVVNGSSSRRSVIFEEKEMLVLQIYLEGVTLHSTFLASETPKLFR